MCPEKHHRFGLRKSVGLTPENKQADRGIEVSAGVRAISSYRTMMRNERLEINKILLFLHSIYLKSKIARFLACSVGVTMREIALTHGS
jgi:hypothetical protein